MKIGRRGGEASTSHWLSSNCKHWITSSSKWSFNANAPQHPALTSLGPTWRKVFKLLRLEFVPSLKKNPSFWKWLILRMRQAKGTKFKEVADMIFIPLSYHFPSPQGSYTSTCLDRTFGFLEKIRVHRRLPVCWIVFFENLGSHVLRNLQRRKSKEDFPWIRMFQF